jgi:2,4-dienoyl-CoA reductase-like NADH-dependent reductase (Old Yellow Enzyme family)/thioredoxin reductase
MSTSEDVGSNFPNLFSPLDIGNITIRNRLLQTAHYKGFAAGEGLVNDREVYYQTERAAGGTGLLITGARHAHPQSVGPGRTGVRSYRKESIAREKVMTDAVHEFGGRIFAQLIHFGPQGRSEGLDDHRVLWAPTALKSPVYNETPKEIEKAEMQEVSDYFARTACNSRASGYDGVELHYSHGYLHQQFLSFVYNKRKDEYGGSMENIVRFPLETIDRVRSEVGDDFVVGVRVSLDECTVDGMHIDQAIEMTKLLVASKELDFVNVTAGTYAAHADQIPPGDYEENWLVDRGARLRKGIREVSEIPMFIVGHIGEPDVAEEIVKRNSADVVGMTRSQIADPQFANKLKEGRSDDIVRCIRCNQGCIGRVMQANAMGCAVNPAAGREQVLGNGTAQPTDQPGNWVVVGGGPGGLMAATTLAERGHSVSLLEQNVELGGQMRLAAMLPRRNKFAYVCEDLANHAQEAGVHIQVSQKAEADDILALEPDGIVLATGSIPLKTGESAVRPAVDKVPGMERDDVLTVPEVLMSPERVGKRVLLFDEDGTRHGIGTAEYLLDRNHEVHMVTRFTSLAPGTVLTLDLPVIYREVFERGMTFNVNHWARSIDSSQVTLFNVFTDVDVPMEPFDTYVIAAGHAADDDLYHALKNRHSNIYRIGDCVAPRPFQAALYEGMMIGRGNAGENAMIEHGTLEEWTGEGILEQLRRRHASVSDRV